MSPPRQLKVMGPRESHLGRATIMDRALAQRYGAAYVHLAAFAIDVDRVREHGEGDLPFAWEVFLTEAHLAQLMDTSKTDPAPMLEDVCLGIIEAPRGARSAAPPLGSQLPFAIYTAVARGVLPPRLGQCFASWKKPPRALIGELEKLDADPGLLARAAEHCLRSKVEPPVIAPVREALAALAASAQEIR